MKTKMTKAQQAEKTRLLAETNARHANDWAHPGFAEAYAQWEREYDATTALCKARLEANLTQEELARRMKTPRAQISRIENGQNITLATFARYLRGCGFDFAMRIFPIGADNHPAAHATLAAAH